MAHLLIARTCLTQFMPVDLRLTATTTARFTAVHIITGSQLTAYNKKKTTKNQETICNKRVWPTQHFIRASVNMHLSYQTYNCIFMSINHHINGLFSIANTFTYKRRL